MLLRRSLGELVEDVEITFVGDLADDARLLEQIVVDVCSDGLALRVEVYLQVLAKARRVVVAKGFRVSEGFQERVCSEHHVFDALDAGIGAAGNTGDVLHDALGSFCLASAGFSRDDDALIFFVALHVVVRGLGDCEDVWRHLQAILASVAVENGICIDPQVSKGIDGNQHMANVCLTLPLDASRAQARGQTTYVNDLSLESFLQVFIDGFVCNLAEQCKIIHTRATGFRGLEYGAFDGAFG